MVDFSKLRHKAKHRFIDDLSDFTKGPQVPSNHPYSRKQETIHLYYTEYQTMDTSAFDPNHFLDATMEEALVARPPLPAGRDFVAVLGEPKQRPWKSKDDPTKQGIAIDIAHEFIVASLPADIQEGYKGPDGKLIEKIVVVDGIMLDLTENGALDMAPGKNGKLRQYREALDLNKPGDKFNLRMLQGRQVRSKIKHEPYQGNVYDKIASIGRV